VHDLIFCFGGRLLLHKVNVLFSVTHYMFRLLV
jgi:hypothetical protein